MEGNKNVIPFTAQDFKDGAACPVETAGVLAAVCGVGHVEVANGGIVVHLEAMNDTVANRVNAVFSRLMINGVGESWPRRDAATGHDSAQAFFLGMDAHPGVFGIPGDRAGEYGGSGDDDVGRSC